MPGPRTTALAGIALAAWSAANLVWSISLARAPRAEEHGPPPVAHEGPVVPARPARTLAVHADARDAILTEMRVMLGSVQGALEASIRGDTAALRAAVRPSGMAMAADPALEAMLPAEWMTLALGVHRGFDSLPGAGADPTTVTAGLSRLIAGCNGCHAVYRLEVR